MHSLNLRSVSLGDGATRGIDVKENRNDSLLQLVIGDKIWPLH